MNNCLLIAANEAGVAAQGKATLEEQLEAAMQATKEHWLVTDREERFKAAVAGVLSVCTPEDRIKIENALDILKVISHGNFSRLGEIADNGIEVVPLLPMWNRICPAR